VRLIVEVIPAIRISLRWGIFMYIRNKVPKTLADIFVSGIRGFLQTHQIRGIISAPPA
jgi:hypothetical protein